MLSCFRCDNMILQKSTTIQVGKCIFGHMNPAKTQISLRFRFEASHVSQTCVGGQITLIKSALFQGKIRIIFQYVVC